MNNLYIRNIARFLLLTALQILILNYVYLGGYVVPFIYVLFILMLPTNTNRMLLLLLAFASGGCVDLFCNVPGFHTFSCTMMAFARIVVGNNMLIRNNNTIEIETPHIYSLPMSHFMSYLAVMLAVYSITFFMLEVFSFGQFWMTLLSFILSSMVSWMLCILYQLIVFQKKK